MKEVPTAVVHVIGMDISVTSAFNVSAMLRFIDCHTVVSVSDWRLAGWQLFDGCQFDLDSTGSTLTHLGNGHATFRNCSLASGSLGTSFYTPSRDSSVDIVSCDFSNGPSGMAIINDASLEDEYHLARITGCKLATAGVVPFAAIDQQNVRIEAYSVGISGAVVQLEIHDGMGVAIEDTSTYRSATYDGSTGYSIKLSPTASATYTAPFRVKIFERYCTANPTFKIHMAHGTDVTLTDAEVWIEIDYPDITNPVWRKVDVTSRAADLLVAGTGLTTGSATGWTSPPASPAYDEIEETITGGGAGVHRITICYAKASGPELFVDPRVDVT